MVSVKIRGVLLALMLVGGSVGASAQNSVTLNFESESSPVVYKFASLTVDAQGAITIEGAEYETGSVPGIDGNTLGCGANTELVGNLCVGTGGGNSSASTSSSQASSSSQTSSSSSQASSSSSAGGGDSSCPADPTGVVRSTLPAAFVKWDMTTQTLPYNLTQKTVNAAPFTASNTVGVSGTLGFALDSSSGAVAKDVWISKCAGGEPVHAQYCIRKTALTSTIRWVIGGPDGTQCALEPGEKYFLNTQNVFNTCQRTSGCSMLLVQRL